MKGIKECFDDTKPLVNYIEQSNVDEGVRDWVKTVKDKFNKAWAYLKGVVAKFGTYFLPVNEDGEIMEAISPLTAGQAYKDGHIKTVSTHVVLDKAGSKIVGLPRDYDGAYSLYGSGNSIDYWKRAIKECQEIKCLNSVNEVKLHNTDPQAKYNIVVDNDQLKDRIKRHIKNPKLPKLLIWGAPGIGKSAILNNILTEMKKDFPDYNLIIKTLSSDTPDNFTLPTYEETENGRRAADIPKTWMPVYKPSGNPMKDELLDAACGKGLLFIDELSRATPQVLNVILPLVNEGYFNGYKVGSGWTIICASNRMDDETAGQSDLGNALVNRFAQIYYEPSVKTWRKWADAQGYMSPLLLQWLSMPESENMSGGKFYYYDPNETIDNEDTTKIMCTPRSWTNAMITLCDYAEVASLEGFKILDIPRDIIAMALNTCVPADAIDSFLSFLDVISRIGNFDAAVHDIWQNGGKNFKLSKKDLNLVALPLSQLVVSAHADSLPTEEEFINLSEWLAAQNSDQLASYTLDVFKNVFLNSVAEQYRNAAFTGPEKLKRAKTSADESILNTYRDGLAPFYKKWKISLETAPNWYTGIMIIGKKYGASFEAAVVDGHVDALG